LLDRLNKVWGLEGCSLFFTLCAQIVESGLVSAGLPCYRVLVEIRCRLTRQLEVIYGCFKEPRSLTLTRCLCLVALHLYISDDLVEEQRLLKVGNLTI